MHARKKSDSIHAQINAWVQNRKLSLVAPRFVLCQSMLHTKKIIENACALCDVNMMHLPPFLWLSCHTCMLELVDVGCPEENEVAAIHNTMQNLTRPSRNFQPQDYKRKKQD